MKPGSSTMQQFIDTADAVASTTRKNEKIKLISELFTSLSLDDASLAAQFLTGHAFPQFEERVVGIGGVTLSRAVARAPGKESHHLGAAYWKHVRLGDMDKELLLESSKKGDLYLMHV